MPDWLLSLGFAMGSAWLSGINLYATVAVLGLLHHFHLARLPGQLGVLGEWWIIGLAAALYCIEFVADKIPAVDSAWDVVHTFIRVPAGAALASAAFSNADMSVRIVALLLGGGIALTSHGTKATIRAAANLSPEPFSNSILSVIEDIFTVSSSVVMAFFPIAMICFVAIALVIVIWLGPKFFRSIRSRMKPSSKAAAR